MKTIIPFAAALLRVALACAQIPVSSPAFSYSQTFTSPDIPPGWRFVETGANADEAFGISTGSNSAGNTYLLGTPSEYAFGGLQSGTLVPTIGVCFTNTMPDRDITGISLQFIAETWRVGTSNRSDGLDFQFNMHTSGIDGEGIWTDVNELDYRNPGQATGTGNVKHSTSFSRTFSGLSIAPGTTFCMRWLDLDATDADDAIGIDNFNVTSIATVLPVEWLHFSARREAAAAVLSFSTATEHNNDHFVVERSADARTFTEIGHVQGAGTTQVAHAYTFTDEMPMPGANYYRLRQVDFDGRASFSSIVRVVFSRPGDIVLAPSPATDHMRIRLEEAPENDGRWQVFDQTGRPVLSGAWAAETADLELDVRALPEGMYTFRLVVGAREWVKEFGKL